MSSKKPDAADIYIGRRVQERRRQLGLSQERLGEQLGITFQQVQKYEKGANRIGAGRLYSISAILQTPVGFFYQGFEADTQADGFRDGDGQPSLSGDPSAADETAELVRDFARIADPAVRRTIVDLVRSLGGACGPASRRSSRN